MNTVLARIMDVGELLLESTAEVNRVEDTVRRLCSAYGFVRTDVFTITSIIIVTAIMQDGTALTQTRRIYSTGTDLGRIEKLNAFSRKICQNPVPIEEMQRELERIRAVQKENFPLEFLVYGGISAVFAAFFGGSPIDSLAAFFSGIFLFGMVLLSRRLHMKSIFQSMICSAVTALVVMLLIRLGIGENPDKIMIGNIMLVIPGIQLTTSLRDMMNGDIITGSLNLAEAVMKAMAIAAGFAFVVSRLGA
ncbi:MAG: threonine/serine exporter family protein [Lachnospiraceae bacterium]|nr:threonine/serine exporter family protein [Lachnospiraceae bacterium]